MWPNAFHLLHCVQNKGQELQAQTARNREHDPTARGFKSSTLDSAFPTGRRRNEGADSSNTLAGTENQCRASQMLICKSPSGYESVFFSKQLVITSLYSVSRTPADRHWQSVIITTKERTAAFLLLRRREILRTPTSSLTPFPCLIYFIINLKNNIKCGHKRWPL